MVMTSRNLQISPCVRVHLSRGVKRELNRSMGPRSLLLTKTARALLGTPGERREKFLSSLSLCHDPGDLEAILRSNFEP